ncbi:MAG: oxidoreductase [marine bacterium B5-7]|nr:MAG: oxidoreductase [marine bacterium B5-7]
MNAKYSDVAKARRAGRQPRRQYPYRRSPELDSDSAGHASVVIAGGGPIGLAMALELAGRGIASVVLEKHDTVSDGSRAICWAKRTLEIFDRLGVAGRMMEKGIIWNTGKVFVGNSNEPVYTFDLLPDKAQKFPAFINLQQYYPEEYLIDLIEPNPLIELRWMNEVVGVDPRADGVGVTVHTVDGDYTLECDYLIAADGHRSPIRNMLGLDFEGRVFEDHFLIADVRMKADFPAERRFWFDPPFNPGQTSLLHKQADDVWRIDFQVGSYNINRDEVLADDNVDRMVRAFLGPDIEFEYEWVSLYTFQCRRMQDFVHGRVIFTGDAAHLVSPFGARGANGGIQDVDNLGWKLALVLKGLAPDALLASYNDERIYGADENIRNSSRSTDFLTPKNDASRAFRNAALRLARDFPFARAFVNSGRLSVPCVLDDSRLNTPDEDEFGPRMRPGAACIDAPVSIDGKRGWFVERLGTSFTVMLFTERGELPEGFDNQMAPESVEVERIVVARQAADGALHDVDVLLEQHYDSMPGTVYLIRPDQHVAARWRHFDIEKIRSAARRALALN